MLAETMIRARLALGGLLVLCLAACAVAPPSAPKGGPVLYPADGAANINPDVQLKLTFDVAPSVGSTGLIRVIDTATGKTVDEIDMSLPPSPRPNGRLAGATQAKINALSKGYERSAFQLLEVQGTDFHFFPVLVEGATATVQLHHGQLDYGRTYRVEIEPGAITLEDGEFEGASWTFSTRPAAPDASTGKVVVDASGAGDFNTLQGALDFASKASAKPFEIFIRNGHYRELVLLSDASNITIRGESRDGVVVSYPNNSIFNPSQPGPWRRPAFSLHNVEDIRLSNFTIRNEFIGQAEALLVRGERVIIDEMTLDGSGDALTTFGSIYMADSSLRGDGDTILAYATLYCLRCDISSVGPFVWPRTPEGQHGNVFIDSTFTYLDQPLPWTVSTEKPEGQKTSGVLARLPFNGPVEGPRGPRSNFPHAEMVLINARLDGVPAEGWGPVEQESDLFNWDKMFLAEFGSTDLSGAPIDLSGRAPPVRVLDATRDAEVIENYRSPAYVLDGWTPVLD